MWSVNVMSLLLFCYACLSIGDGEVYFSSKDFFNVLQWDPVNPAFPGQKVLYSVQFHRDYEQHYHLKQECQNITSLSCNLTAETPSAHDVYYRAKVCVSGRACNCTTSFMPLRHTNLSAPVLSTYTTPSVLHIKVTLPLGPNGVSIADIITKSKQGFSKTVPLYILKITNPEWAAQEIQNTKGQFEINLKYNQTSYCGYVVYRPASEWGRSDSEKAFFCETLKDDRMLLQWLLMGVALLATVAIISAVCVCNYVKGGKTKSMPQGLVTTFKTCKPLQHLDKNLIIFEAQVCSENDHKVNTIKLNQNGSSRASGGYFPQGVCQGSKNSFEGSSEQSRNPDPEDTSAQSSEIYSGVVVHVQPGQNYTFQNVFTKNRETRPSVSFSEGEVNSDGHGIIPDSALHEAPTLADFIVGNTSPNHQLVLQTVRTINGQLVCPSLKLMLKSDIDEQMNPEWKPLLSDLTNCQDGPSLASLQSFDSSELHDSGCDDSAVNTPTGTYCNQHYSHSQMVPFDKTNHDG
ncbi:interferon lambda receptor 1 [Menidia menidia]